MNRSARLLLLPHLFVLGLVLPAYAQTPDAALVAKAKAIHERVITLDTHDDIDVRNFTPERNYTQRLDNQVNLPKMEEGGLDASFFIVYVGQGPLTREGYDRAYAQAVAKFDAIHRLTEQIAPAKIGLALTAGDVRTIAASGRKVALIGVENAYPIGTDLVAHQGVPRPRRTLHVARAQRAQPVRRLEHRRTRRQVAAQRPERPRQAGHRRDEPRRAS